MNPDYKFYPLVYYKVCKNCVVKTKQCLSKSNRIDDKLVASCSNAAAHHISDVYRSTNIIDAFYSPKHDKWFFTNDHRRRLVRDLQLAFPDVTI
jgi:hypothetical protein